MKTYYCERCGVEKKIGAGEYRSSNPDIWCYCNPELPLRLALKGMKDYSRVFRGAMK